MDEGQTGPDAELSTATGRTPRPRQRAAQAVACDSSSSAICGAGGLLTQRTTLSTITPQSGLFRSPLPNHPKSRITMPRFG